MIPILENVAIARDTFRLRLGDADMARALRPGQFVMIRPGSRERPIRCSAGRWPSTTSCAIPRARHRHSTSFIWSSGAGPLPCRSGPPGERLAVWGPLGNGFGPPPMGPAVFVAGGIGQTPFLALGRSWLRTESRDQEHFALGNATEETTPATDAERQAGGSARMFGAVVGSAHRTSRLTLLYGVRTAALLAGVDDFRRAGIEVELATDDGTAGHHGFVTELLARRLDRGERPAKVVGCGPPAMLAALAKLVASHHIACEVSLENHMACGFGACFSCVAPIRQDDGSSRPPKGLRRGAGRAGGSRRLAGDGPLSSGGPRPESSWS